VSVGRMGGQTGDIDLDELARKRISLVGVTFRTRTPQQLLEVYRRASADILPALDAGRLQVVIDRTFEFGDVKAAQEWMQTGRQIGKVVLLRD
jgi:NADPH2:quinone reductase